MEQDGDARYPIQLVEQVMSRTPARSFITAASKGHGVVLGDDRRHWIHSRSFGPVPLAGVVERVA